MKMMGSGMIVRLLLAAAAAVAGAAGPGSAAGAEVRNLHGVAVIIGNHRYEDRDIPPVDYALRDAEAFRRFVIDVLGFRPENVIHLENATRRQMADALGRPGAAMNDIQARLNMVAPDEGSDVVVYYSGHGVPGKEGEEKGAFLLPVDVAPGEAQDDGYGYSLALLRENLGALRLTKSVRVYLDACFTGTSDGGRLVEGSVVYETPAYPEEVTDTMMLLTAVKGTQIARWDRETKHGLFTDQLLDALYGGGDVDKNGEVTAGEVHAYLDRHMSARAWTLHRKTQDAVLTTRAPLSDLVLAREGPGGAFPPRPDLENAANPVAGDTARNETGDTDTGDGRTPSSSPLGGRAILVVKTEPAGVSVVVGGERVGETPLTRSDLRPGTWSVVLDHPWHETVRLEDQVLKDRRVHRIERSLVRASGEATVLLEPPVSRAWVEHEAKRREIPVTLDGLPVGPVVLVLGAPGHHELRVEVEVPKGGVAMVYRRLEPILHGTLTVTTVPADASVTVEGVGPYRVGMRLPLGNYRVRVSREGYLASESEVEIAGESSFRVVLERETHAFTVVAEPSGAEVRLLDVAERYRPGMALPPGTYRVQVSASGWEPQVSTVVHGRSATRHVVRLKNLPKHETHAFMVETEPFWAEVRLLDVVERYWSGMELPPGTYRVRVSASGWEPRVATVEHGRSATRHVVRLKSLSKRETHAFTVETEPFWAEVRLLDVVERYWSGMELPPGTYRVRVSASGWEPWVTTVEHGRSATRHVVRLKKQSLSPK